MEIIRDVLSCPPAYRGAVVALGNFDGVHLGHQEILATARKIAQAEGKKFAALTFEPHPRQVLQPGKEKLRIDPFRRKAQLMKAAGVEVLFVMRFNQALATTTSQDFVQKVLCDALGTHHVVTGYNFFFGHNRAGDKDFLASEAARLGFGYTPLPPVVDEKEGQPISSSRVRSILKMGSVDTAATLLGRPFRITGHVMRGDRRGRNLGYPTANISLGKELFMPRYGVYSVRLTMKDGKRYSGIANLGMRPTFDRQKLMLEVHIFDFKGDIYGQRVEVDLMYFLREEKNFTDIAALRIQVVADTKRARMIAERWIGRDD